MNYDNFFYTLTFSLESKEEEIDEVVKTVQHFTKGTSLRLIGIERS
jgi:hypothetical protein